jgi:uncharacterized protein YbbK (DUF523 family)
LVDEGTGATAAIVVSACLLGVRCNHLGAASPSPAVAALADAGYRLVPVCPETMGGLPTPRPAAEVLAGDGDSGGGRRVVTGDGSDVTDAYARGAAATVLLARAVGAADAVLKARSPSCGCHQVYDGSFSRRLVPGLGITAAALVAAGVRVHSDEDVADAAPGTLGRPGA